MNIVVFEQPGEVTHFVNLEHIMWAEYDNSVKGKEEIDLYFTSGDSKHCEGEAAVKIATRLRLKTG